MATMLNTGTDLYATPTSSSLHTPLPLASSVSRRMAHLTNSAIVSPKTPRVILPRVIQVNDDEEERQRRRLKKNMCAMISPGCHTPKGVASSGRGNK